MSPNPTACRTSIARGCRRFGPAFLGVMLCASGSFAQDVTEPSLKAALIYNFARFTEWPPDLLAPNAPFVACVLGGTPVGQALDRTVKGRVLAGRTVSVTHIAPDGPLRSCQLLYVSGVNSDQGARIAAGLRGFPVLTIIDIEGPPTLGGIARVFVENGKMRFDLDYGLAKRSRLQLSSKLLSLASRVHDEPAGATK